MTACDRNEISQGDVAEAGKVLLLEFLTKNQKVPIFFKKKFY